MILFDVGLLDTVLALTEEEKRALIYRIQKSLPPIEILIQPELGIEHTIGAKWNYPKLMEDFEKVNPDVTVTKECIRATFRKHKTTITRIRELHDAVKAEPLQVLRNLNEVFDKHQGQFQYSDKPAKQLTMHLFLDTFKREEEGRTYLYHKINSRVSHLVDTDAGTFTDTDINTNGMPELNINLAPSLTPEQKGTLLTGLSKRHINPKNNNYVYELITLELFVLYGVYYIPTNKELQPKDKIKN